VVSTEESQTDQHGRACCWAEFSSAAYQPITHSEIFKGSCMVVGFCIGNSLKYLDLKKITSIST